MVIDFHTHTFPDAIAARAVSGMASGADIKNYSDGTAAGLKAVMDRAGVTCAVLAPVATKPGQTGGINRLAAETDRKFSGRGLVSLGGIHPDNDDYAEILGALRREGVPGIKLHPLFQGVPADDIRFKRIVERAAELDMTVLIHAGDDPNFPGLDLASPARLGRLLRDVPWRKTILAHMGGFARWDEARELWGGDFYLDTAVALGPWRRSGGSPSEGRPMTGPELAAAVRAHGADRVLFGSDSPWSDEAEALSALRGSGLTEEELRKILWDNGAALLGLEET